MTRLEKCELAKQKGYTYDKNTGNIIGMYGKIIKKKTKGYITMNIDKFYLYAHHFAWYMTYGDVEFEMLDHINRDKTDNRISNLRKANSELNNQNKIVKGYTWDNDRKKWLASIQVSKNKIHLGYYKTEEEAKQAYLLAKQKYHII